MVKRRKGQNSVVAKNQLVSAFEEARKQLEYDRWAATDDGKDAIKKESEYQAKMIAIRTGQLVWKDAIIETNDSDRILNVCCKIIAFDDYGVTAEMLYCLDNVKNKFEAYTDWDNIEHKKGDNFFFELNQLEKHVSKTTGNVWWKVK